MRFGRTVLAVAAVASLLVAACGSDDEAAPDDGSEPAAVEGPDPAEAVPASPLGAIPPMLTQFSGNRSIPLGAASSDAGTTTRFAAALPTASARTFGFDSTVRWVIGLGGGAEPDWVVVLDDGSAQLLGSGSARPLGAIRAGEQPEVVVGEDASLEVRSASTWARALVDDPLLDGVHAQSATTGASAVLTEPTERYPHDVLGDPVEAGAITVLGAATDPLVIPAAPPAVFETRQPMWADVDGDGTDELVATESDFEVGARIVVFTAAGERVAQSEPIGRGNRWRHVIAVAPMTDDETPEVMSVLTPHIGGPLQFMRSSADGRLEVVAEVDGFTSHVLGSPNLDMALVLDADGDGEREVVLPTTDRTALGVISRDGGAATVDAIVDLPGRLTSNLTVAPVDGGDLWVAAGVDDQLVVWPGG